VKDSFNVSAREARWTPRLISCLLQTRHRSVVVPALTRLTLD
jgi:hypothetical protein